MSKRRTVTTAPYLDRCDECQPRVVVPPVMVRRDVSGTGVVADYICPAGHTWYTSWAWRSGVPHATDEAAS